MKKIYIQANDELMEIKNQSDKFQKVSSNLKNALSRGLDLAENISQFWISADVYQKQKLQYLIFPKGMMYDKQNQRVLTFKVNSIFSEIAATARVLDEKTNGNLLKDCHSGSNVGLPGFEPRQTESKSVVLPLHNNPISSQNFF